MEVDVLVIGAGAAGLMCAVEAGKRGLRVAVLEHADRVGKKILISGGGRCNFTNRIVKPEHFLSANPHFCKSALSRYTPEDFLELIRRHRISFHEKKLGQLFCDDSAKQIVAMLLKECSDAQVQIFLNRHVSRVEKNGKFEVQTAEDTFQSPSLVIATGGLSFARLGASPFGYRVAEYFGHAIQPCRPALVPLTLGKEQGTPWSELSGVSAEVEVSCRHGQFRENLLFTHQGLSGPAILQISSYWEAGESIRINLLPDLAVEEFLLERKRGGEKSELKNLLAQFLPKRLIERWCELYFPSSPLQQYTDAELRRVAALLQHWVLNPDGTEGYEKAEVTRGGVDTREFSSKTMESQRVPGLYFVGEVLDVTGHLGGFNFQWAWASGFVAGRSVSINF